MSEQRPKAKDSPLAQGGLSLVETGHSKAKIRKSRCKNEYESLLNPEISFFAGIFFVKITQ